MNALRLPMSSPAQPSRPAPRGVSPSSKRIRVGHCIDQLAVRDHRDDGSLIGGLIVMLSLALPFWVMVILLLASLL